MFNISLPTAELYTFVFTQLNHFFPDNRQLDKEKHCITAFHQALERTEHCFKHVALKSYHEAGTTSFSHVHADQYTIFLWFLSNSVWKQFEDNELASKLFYLNKTLNGVVCMYDANMPDIFLIVHGGGIVLGKATYSDFFVCYQGCTVGAIEGTYPVFGRGVVMAPQSSVIGNCHVGSYVTIGNHSLLRNKSLGDKTLYYCDTEKGGHQTRQHDKPWAQSFFNIPIE